MPSRTPVATTPTDATAPTATAPPADAASPSRAAAPGPASASARRPEVTAAACRPASLAGDLRVSVTRTARRLRAERSSEQISDSQYSVLAALANRGPMTPTALADDQHMQPPPMTRIVNALVEAGLARRDEHPTDRRQVVVSITEAGLAEVKETRRRRNAWLASQLAALTSDEREVLARASVLLERIATR